MCIRDSFQSPYSLCQPERPNSKGVVTATVAMVIMEPELGVMEVAPLPSRGTEPVTYSLAQGEIRKAG